MFLGRVIGRLVPAVVTPGMEGFPLLWVQPLDKHQETEGRPFVCADGTRQAGPGETIYWEASREAALTLEPSYVPVDHAVVGIVDDVQLDEVAKPKRRRRKKTAMILARVGRLAWCRPSTIRA